MQEMKAHARLGLIMVVIMIVTITTVAKGIAISPSILYNYYSTTLYMYKYYIATVKRHIL